MTTQDQLKYVYKASDCTDLNDAEYAISEVKRIANGNYTKALRKRLNSLEKRKTQLS